MKGWLVVLLLSFATPALAARPSVGIIVLDDIPRATLLASPRIMALAQQGFRANATVVTPLCAPARATILTGKQPQNTGVNGNLNNDAVWLANAHGQTIANWLHDAGYYTIKAGKWVNGVSPDYSGWDLWLNRKDKVGQYWIDNLAMRTADAMQAQPGDLLVYFAPDHDWYNPPPLYAGTHAGVPLPAVPNLNEPDVSDKMGIVHDLPLLTQAQLAQLQLDYQMRLDIMDSIADAIESIIAAFGTRPYVIVIVPDNGNFMGEHRIYKGKGQHYEEASEVPLFIFGAGVPATQTDALVYQADIAPTLAELVGITPPSGLDGRSLVPLMTNPALAWRERVLLHERYTGLRTKRRKYVEWNDGECEWYNLVLDPYELQNRCLPGCACGDTMRASVQELASCHGDSCWEAEIRP